MDTKLKEQLWAVAKEYARQFGELIGYDPDFWIGDEPSACSFGDYYFNLDEMREVVDSIGKYVKKYGTKEAVGQEILSWADWWMDGISDGGYMERALSRVTHHLRPNINLVSWLNGCPRDGDGAWSGPDADLMKRELQKTSVVELMKEYGHDATLLSVSASLTAKLIRMRKEKQVRDKEEFDRIIDGKSGRDFAEAIANEEGQP